MKRSFNDIAKICQKYLLQKDLQKIDEAFQFAEKVHQGQKRKNGDDFIQHPLHTALTLAQMNLDAATIIAALLHDTVEDGGAEFTQIQKKFGDEVADLVSGVTKVSEVRLKKYPKSIKLDDREKNQIENLRKMFVAMAKDIRVILIKLADRLHNMHTLYALPTNKAERIARETLEIYAPIAHRLGMGEIKGELEDLSFPYIYPEEYKKVKTLIGEKESVREEFIEEVIKKLHPEFQKEKIKIINISGRAKHLYSFYKKLLKYNFQVNKIYDLMAVRIIVPSVSDCYKVLGIIHRLWKPLPGYIKDYIAMPKPNGYESLHTTVFSLEGKPCEVQIRTQKMHEHAEFGVAAHWHYTTQIEEKNNLQKKSTFAPKNDLGWVSHLAKIQEKLKNPQEFREALQLDFFSDRIFVFTPEGEVRNLPIKSTPIDFAYSVHSEIGDHCQGAKVNDKMTALDHELENGDIIEIITSKKAKPKHDWLKLAKTAVARSLIKRYLKKETDFLDLK